MKGSNVKRYTISKPLGKIKPLSTQEIHVEMALNDIELVKITNISDKFCCFYTYIDEEDAERSEKELEQILKKKQNNKTIYRIKIKSIVSMPESGLSHSEESEFLRASNMEVERSSGGMSEEKTLMNSLFNSEEKSSLMTDQLNSFKNPTEEVLVETSLVHSENMQDSIDINIERELKQVMQPPSHLSPLPAPEPRMAQRSHLATSTSKRESEISIPEPSPSEIIQVLLPCFD
jgi:hypothetical protein